MDDLTKKTPPTVKMPSIIPVQPTDPPGPKLASHRWLVLVIIGILALGGIGVAAYQIGVSNSDEFSEEDDFFGDTDEETQEDETVSCALPVTDVPAQAFSYGVPDGWISEQSGDTLSIMEDERNLTAAFIYTAKLQQSLSATDFLDEFGTIFKSTIEDAGGSFSLGDASEANDIATAEAAATVEEGDLKGIFTVLKTDGFVTLKVYWAPVAEFATKEPTLKTVVDCFDRKTVLTDADLVAASQNAGSSNGNSASASLVSRQGTYFSYAMPANWRVLGESDSGLDLEGPNGEAYVGYAYATGLPGPISTSEWAAGRLEANGINASLGSAQSLPGVDSNQEVAAYEFSGTLGGSVPVKGKITVGIYNVPGIIQSYASPFWAIQMAKASLWDSYKATTQAVQDSMAITDIGSRKNITLPKGNRIDDVGGSSITASQSYKDSVSDSSSQKWADGMRGYETVESPSTNQTYDAPLNSWNTTGPDGPGYYRGLPDGSLEKLTQTNP